jgi:alkylated DNA repair protein alkB homolog 6
MRENSSDNVQINSAPLPRWTQLSHRRLQTWPSALTKSNTLIASPLPDWLHEPIIHPRLESLGCFADAPHQAPNHVLINEYRPGQGIMPHEDGPAYYPLVATVSLAGPIVLDLYEKKEQEEGIPGVNQDTVPSFRILQEPRSLLITTESLYTQYLHGIADRPTDENLTPESICNWDLLGDPQPYSATGVYERQTRISLTYRDVLKVAKLGYSVTFLNRGR